MKLDGINEAMGGFGNQQAEKDEALGKTAFLELLVTQLGNQDPLSPSDPTEFVSQLAQFTSLEQLTNVNEGIDVLAMSQTAATSAQMVSFVGKEVSYDGDVVTLGQAGEEADLSFRLEGDTKATTVEIRSADGAVVRTLELGGMSKGNNRVLFDGVDDDGNPLPAGQYSFEVKGESPEGEDVEATSGSNGVVTGVVFENGYPELVVEGGQTLTLSQIKQVVDPDPDSGGSGRGASERGRGEASDSKGTDNS
ncbi:MAG: flagellar hook assembly protein FlgD [Myxococcota bacterium]